MLVVNYCKDRGHCLPDALIMDYCESKLAFLKNFDSILISQVFMIDCFRYLLKTKYPGLRDKVTINIVDNNKIVSEHKVDENFKVTGGFYSSVFDTTNIWLELL